MADKGGGGVIPLFLGCQWCKDLLSVGLAKGFAWTIGLLLLVPALLVVVIALRLAWSARRQTRQRS